MTKLNSQTKMTKAISRKMIISNLEWRNLLYEPKIVATIGATLWTLTHIYNVITLMKLTKPNLHNLPQNPLTLDHVIWSKPNPSSSSP